MKQTDIIETELIINLKKGSRKAFDTIYTMYAKRLYAYCIQYTKSKEDAEEIVQDVFVRLWTCKKSIRQKETLRNLLFIMSKHYLINAYRKHINSPIYEDYIKYQNDISSINQTSPLEYEEFEKQVKAILYKLPATQSKVIEMSKLNCLSNKKIALKLQLSEQTVKNQLSLGLKQLREELKNIRIPLWLLYII